MREQLRRDIERMFEGAPKTRRILDMKEEILSNGCEKYDDMVARGQSEKDAYDSVLYSIGDVRELLRELVKEDAVELGFVEDPNKKKKALVTAISVGMYILAGMALIGISSLGEDIHIGRGEVDEDVIALMVAMLLCVIPTMALVYMRKAYPSYEKMGESAVEEYKAWKSQKEEDKEFREAVKGSVWVGILILYFLLSFSTGLWHITWLVFPAGACVDMILSLWLRRR